jgi:hypothetical protein
MAWCGVQAAVEALLPLWALAPLLTGGLQLTPQHTGIALAAAGAALATAHIGTDDLCVESYSVTRTLCFDEVLKYTYHNWCRQLRSQYTIDAASPERA